MYCRWQAIIRRSPIEGLQVCAGGFGILKFNKTPLIYSV